MKSNAGLLVTGFLISLFCLGYFSRFPALFAASLGPGAGSAGSYIPLIHIMNRRFRGRGKAFGLVMGGAGGCIILLLRLRSDVYQISGLHSRKKN